MYIDNSENLTPGVNQFPHCHSTETETHIHFCPKAAEIFDLPSFSRHQSNCSSWPVLTILQNPILPKSPLFTSFFALSFAKLSASAEHNILWFLHIFYVYYSRFCVSRQTVSTCTVHPNISHPVTFKSSYPLSHRYFKSLASVALSQLT